jgi:regulator of PEP synthase PpsR (kinase-PPPase family)
MPDRDHPMSKAKKIVIISDGSGRTAKRLMDAVLVQYDQTDTRYSSVNTYSQVRSKKELDRILREIDSTSLVLFSIISHDQSHYLKKALAARKVLHLDVLQPMLDTMSKFLGVHPGYQPGLLQIIDDRYFRKVDSIGYTVEHDDGRGPVPEEADIMLVGPSRTCKTPISMYLSCNYGLKVANLPIIRDNALIENLMKRLSQVPGGRIVGLLMQPEVLVRVRENRVEMLTKQNRYQARLQGYCDIREVAGEFRYCRDLYVGKGWYTVDVTRRGIEEVSQEILELLNLGRNSGPEQQAQT